MAGFRVWRRAFAEMRVGCGARCRAWRSLIWRLAASDIGAMARFGSSAAVAGGDRFEVGWLSERRRSGSWRCRGEVCGPGLEDRDGLEASLAAVRASADVTAGEPAHDLFDALLGAGLRRGLCEELCATGELVPAPSWRRS